MLLKANFYHGMEMYDFEKVKLPDECHCHQVVSNFGISKFTFSSHQRLKGVRRTIDGTGNTSSDGV